MVAIFVVATIIVFLVIDFFVQRAEKRKVLQAVPASNKPKFVIPKGYYFGKGHTWVEVLSGSLARIGLDDFTQKVLGPIDDISFEQASDEVMKGDKLFTLKQGDKTLSFRAPISGKVVSFNEELVNSPGVLRKKPYSDGWIAIVKPTSIEKETSLLSRGENAAQWLKTEIKRFREFITVQGVGGSMPGSIGLAGATLLDGGAPVEGVMEHSTKETWQKFEMDFLANDEKK